MKTNPTKLRQPNFGMLLTQPAIRQRRLSQRQSTTAPTKAELAIRNSAQMIFGLGSEFHRTGQVTNEITPVETGELTEEFEVSSRRTK